MIHKAAGEARDIVADAELHRVHHRSLDVAAHKDDLVRLQVCGETVEKVAVRSLTRAVDGVSALIDEAFRGLGGDTQIIIRRMVGRIGARGNPVILHPGALEKGDAGFEGERRPFVDADRVLGRGQLFNGHIKVFQYLVNHIAARVARLAEQVGVRRTDDLIVPRHIAEAFDFLEIQVGAEEMGDALVFLQRSLVAATAAVLQEIIDAAQFVEVPLQGAAHRVGRHTRTFDDGTHSAVDHIVRIHSGEEAYCRNGRSNCEGRWPCGNTRPASRGLRESR